MFKGIKDFVVTEKEKAVVSAVITFISTYMVQTGTTWQTLLSKQGLYSLIAAAIAHQGVFWTTNTDKVSTEEGQ